MGKPLAESWFYSDYSNTKLDDRLIFNDDRVIDINIQTKQELRNIKIGMYKKEVLKYVSYPLYKNWAYSMKIKDVSYKQRNIKFKNGSVINIYHELYAD
ncbi:MAG: hypothetical protein A2Y62_10525 [Candidatus Fischerbacteria bacterium RBG_13_37_8]|uniref:Uncharacterized protein n=1 Tax=Candidatus Fischerbacteria bacterium RBG_13_37_8 TaxID=1817863 RepID=A0A1F5VQU8_9BACT|nr:MAG: hypothetical protein A2Y62_10525 [Candidatus Fischerbacteria bacterium RBG_13_37_8]